MRILQSGHAQCSIFKDLFSIVGNLYWVSTIGDATFGSLHHDNIQIYNSVPRILCGILLVPDNTIVNLNNVMIHQPCIGEVAFKSGLLRG